MIFNLYFVVFTVEHLKLNVMNKEAIYYKKTKVLFLFITRNTAEYVNCDNAKYAKIKIQKTGIDQKLIIW